MAIKKMEQKHLNFLVNEFSIKNIALLTPKQKEELFDELFEIEGAEFNADENSERGKISADIANYMYDVFFSKGTAGQNLPLKRESLSATG